LSRLTVKLLVTTLCLYAASLWAKRGAPERVNPVIDHGIEYSASGDGRTQYVVATDLSNHKELWKVEVFHSFIKPWIEEDVQWVFIKDLKLVDNSLLVKDEKLRCYKLDLRSKRVKKQTLPVTHFFLAKHSPDHVSSIAQIL
jgi:hypothetical protein